MNFSKIKSLILNHTWAADAASWYVERKSLYKAYNRQDNVTTCCGIIYMADGRIIHGGLSDRIRGMVSLYSYCRERGIRYYINHFHPFEISDYLEPNKYDWLLDKGQLSFNKTDSKPCIIRPISKGREEYFESRITSHYNKKQLHVYTNAIYGNASFQRDFNELFRPSAPLQNIINHTLSQIGDNYVSLTFRFQQLLGDFKEAKFQVLDEESKNMLINKCLKVVEKVFNENDVTKILVTSDSKLFLDKAQNTFDYVSIIPGEVKHLDYTNDKKDLAYIKSFADLFIISKAKKVYFYSTGYMYNKSHFAETGAMIGGKEYISICE